jgi:hypothetical protein
MRYSKLASNETWKGTIMRAARLHAAAVSIGLSLFISMPSSAQTHAEKLPGVSIKIFPSSTLISSSQNLNVLVTVTNSSGRALSLDNCAANVGLALVSVKDAAGTALPLKPGARDKMLCESRGDSTVIPNGSSITASESVTALFDLSQLGVYTLTKSVELYDQASQTKYTYTAAPVHVTVIQP